MKLTVPILCWFPCLYIALRERHESVFPFILPYEKKICMAYLRWRVSILLLYLLRLSVVKVEKMAGKFISMHVGNSTANTHTHTHAQPTKFVCLTFLLYLSKKKKKRQLVYGIPFYLQVNPAKIRTGFLDMRSSCLSISKYTIKHETNLVGSFNITCLNEDVFT